MKLYCVSYYRGAASPAADHQLVEYRPGQEIDVNDDDAAFLQRSSPGSFTAAPPEDTGEAADVIKRAPDRRQRGGIAR